MTLLTSEQVNYKKLTLMLWDLKKIKIIKGTFQFAEAWHFLTLTQKKKMYEMHMFSLLESADPNECNALKHISDICRLLLLIYSLKGILTPPECSKHIKETSTRLHNACLKHNSKTHSACLCNISCISHVIQVKMCPFSV